MPCRTGGLGEVGPTAITPGATSEQMTDVAESATAGRGQLHRAVPVDMAGGGPADTQ